MRGRARVVLAIMLVAAAQAFGVVPALGADGRTDTATQTYTLDSGAGRVDVVIDLTVQNSRANTINRYICVTPESYPQTTLCDETIRYYVETAAVWVENEAKSLKATADSGSARLALVKKGPIFSEYRVTFARTYGGSTRKLRISYQVPGGAPRSNSDTRISPAFASFCTIANGFDGGSTRVVIPSSYAIQTDAHGAGLTSSTEGSSAVWTTGNLSSPGDFWACFTGENVAGFTGASVAAGARAIQVQSWPGDSLWLRTVTSQVGSSIAALEGLIGRPLPGAGPLVVRETASGSLGAYAGTFNTTTGVARIGEDIEPGVVAHELAHAWFNERLFRTIWLSEGSAGWAESSVSGEACTEPVAYPDTSAPALANWRFAGPRATETDLRVLGWQYDAACHIVSTVAAKVGPDRMRAVLAALIDGKAPYRSDAASVSRVATVADWRDWLEAVDELGLVPAGHADLDFAQKLLASYGAAVDPQLQLPERSAARARYHALRSAVGSWGLPEAILLPMSRWDFDDATKAIETASRAFDLATKADKALPGAELLSGNIKMLFQGARAQTMLDEVEQRATAQLAAAELVAGARGRVAAPRPAVTGLGLTPAALASELTASVSAVARADLPATTEAVATLDRRLADEKAAAELVAATIVRIDAPRDPLAQVGLLGSDFAPSLAAARAAVGSIDLEAARTQTVAIDEQLAGATLQGALRLGLMLLLMVAVVAAVSWRRRRVVAGASALVATTASAALASAALALEAPLEVAPAEVNPAEPSQPEP